MFYFPHDRNLAVDVLVGCFSFIRREAFDAVGLLDENLFMYGDDVDWCRRCWKAGWKVVFFPGAQAIHDRGKTTAPYPVRFTLAQQRSVLYYWSKYHNIFGQLAIRSLMIFRHLMRYTLAALSGLERSPGQEQVDVRRQVSGACLRELLFGTGNKSQVSGVGSQVKSHS
jgi:GT2 family glycosyltransferase